MIFNIIDVHYNDFNKLKNYVPLKVEQHSSTPSIELQAAHDLFHQNFFAEAKLKYSILLDSRNDYQEAWLGLTICNFIIGDYEGAYIASSNLYIFRYRDLINYIEKYRQNDNKSEIEFLISDKTCEELLPLDIEPKSCAADSNCERKVSTISCIGRNSRS